MRGNRMMSFRSRHYPRNASPFMIRQEYTFRFYAVTLFIAMVAIILRMSYGQEILFFGAGAIIVAFLAGAVMGKVALRRNVAEIFFINDGFSIICIDDILDKKPQRTFPLRFASASRHRDQIHLNYEDQVIVLKQEDWGGEFDLIWNWLTQDLQQYQMTRPGGEGGEEAGMDLNTGSESQGMDAGSDG